MPDVAFSDDLGNGWIELKAVKALPANRRAPLKIALRPGQVRWLMERRYTHRIYVLLWVEDEDRWLLFVGGLAQSLKDDLRAIDIGCASKYECPGDELETMVRVI